MVVFQVYGLLTIAAANIALADVIVQPGYAPVGSAYPTAYQQHQTYPMGHYVSQYPATDQQIYPYVTAYQVPAYPAVMPYQYESQDQNPGQFVKHSSMPVYQYVPAKPKAAIVHPSQHMPAHLRARRSTENRSKNRTEIGLADDVSTISPVNDIEMVVDSKDPKTRSITNDGNEQPVDVLQNKEAGAPVVKSTLLNLNPDRMSRDLLEYKPISYEKPADQPVTIRIIHPEPKMRNPVEQRGIQSWVSSTNPTNKQAENQHEEHVDEKARHHESTSPDNAFRNMVQQMQEIQGIAEDKSQQQGAGFRMNPESTLKQMLDKMNHMGSSQPVSQTVQETARTHEQATVTQVDPQSSQLVAATWNNVDMMPQVRDQDMTQEYITGMAQPSQTPVLQIISHAGPQYEQYKSAAPQWQMIMPSYYAPQVPGYSNPIHGYSPQHAAFRNFPDPRPLPTSDSDKESTEHQKAADPSKSHNSTAQYREDHSSKDTAGSEKSVYVASAHTYHYETPEMPSMVSSFHGYSYPATFRSYLNPYPMQSYVMHENSQDSDPILGSSLLRPHHTKYYHKTPGIYDTRPGHAKYITPTTYSYSALRKENPYYKSYLPSTHYMTQYQTDPVPQMIHYKVYI